jgi:hypothetical protein
MKLYRCAINNYTQSTPESNYSNATPHDKSAIELNKIMHDDNEELVVIYTTK